MSRDRAKKRRSKQKPFFTLDCETDPFKAGRIPVPFIWGIYEGVSENYEEFATAAEVVQYLRDRDVVVYAHNGGKFDYHYLRDAINSDDPIMVIAGRLARFKIGMAEFRDSWNVLNEPQRVFAKEEFDYTKLEQDVRAQNIDEIRRYLRSDCVHLWNTINEYFTRYGRALTQAGAAMKYWRREYPVNFKRQTMTQAENYRPFYYGGRVQCFEHGYRKQEFKLVDINSAYPYAMLNRHPISPEAVVTEKLVKDSKLAQCMVRFKAISRGAFPWRGPDHSLYFPNDGHAREYWVTGWELIAAQECGAVNISHILECHHFTQTVDFADYINHFYHERLKAKANGDRLGDVFSKRFMNSLYGKFAADPSKYSEYVIATDDSIDTHREKGFEYAQPWGERFLMARALPEEKHIYYNVATAASVTGLVRSHLFRALEQCNGVLYCDTDSIAARDIGNLEIGSKLGQWKVEMTGDEWSIAGKKLYAFRDASTGLYKTAAKGVNLSASEICAVAQGKIVNYEPTVPTYSLIRQEPVFISREVKRTARDIRIIPDSYVAGSFGPSFGENFSGLSA